MARRQSAQRRHDMGGACRNVGSLEAGISLSALARSRPTGHVVGARDGAFGSQQVCRRVCSPGEPARGCLFPAPEARFAFPEWLVESLVRKKVLIWPEQGFGDQSNPPASHRSRGIKERRSPCRAPPPWSDCSADLESMSSPLLARLNFRTRTAGRPQNRSASPRTRHISPCLPSRRASDFGLAS